MVFIVEMFWGTIDSPEHRFFACHDKVWKELLQLGQAHGWRPAGTVPDSGSKVRWDEDGKFSGDYKPVDWLYCKTVLAEDAAAWAEALELVRTKLRKHELKVFAAPKPILLVEGMTKEEFRRINSGITEKFLTKFLIFLRKGAFSFTYDD